MFRKDLQDFHTREYFASNSGGILYYKQSAELNSNAEYVTEHDANSTKEKLNLPGSQATIPYIHFECLKTCVHLHFSSSLRRDNTSAPYRWEKSPEQQAEANTVESSVRLYDKELEDVLV